MTLLRRTLLKGLLAGSAAAVAAPGLPRAFAAASTRPHPAGESAVVAVVTGSPLDQAFLDHAGRLGTVAVVRLDGDPLARHERLRALLGSRRRVLALLPDADAVLLREAVRHAGGSLLADERAGRGLISLVAHV